MWWSNLQLQNLHKRLHGVWKISDHVACSDIIIIIIIIIITDYSGLAV
jgi:hypothetical protein